MFLFPLQRGTRSVQWLDVLPRQVTDEVEDQNRFSTSPKVVMPNIECGCWMTDPGYNQEVGRRAAQRYLIMEQGGVALEEQRQLDELGANLRALRKQLGLPLEDVACEVGVEPSLLCFLEQGWATKDEYETVLDRLLAALEQSPDEYHQYRPSFMNIDRPRDK